jgi:hypothetical protein
MSIRVMSSVWANSKQSGNDLLVLLALADFADDRGVAFPAVPTLAKKCRMTPRNANRVLAALRGSGELQIDVSAGPRGANLYRICTPTTPDENVTPDNSATLTKSSAPPDSFVPIPLTVPSDEPSVNHQEPPAICDKPLVASKAADPCPHQAIIDLYHQALPTGRQVRIWNDTRKAKLRARWKEDPKRQCLEWWGKFFNYIAESDFLTGKTASAGRRPFELGLEWIVSPENFAKIVEGKYHQEAAA